MTLAVPDVLPRIIVELRDDAAVTALVGQRVRGVEPAPGDAAWEQFDDGRRKYAHNFVVVTRLDSPRHRSLPVQTVTLGVACYGVDRRKAAELRWACSNALHRAGPRTHANGLGIYQTLEEGGGEQDTDPDTGQPLERFVVQAIATTQVVV